MKSLNLEQMEEINGGDFWSTTGELIGTTYIETRCRFWICRTTFYDFG